jgi:hypothetical protein
MTGPYTPLTSSLVTITNALITQIEGGTYTIVPADLAAMDVFYGDQDRIPRTPAVCVEPGEKNRELDGAPNMTRNTMDIFVLIYHNKMQEQQLTRLETDKLAEEIERRIHQNLQLGGIIIHGFCVSNESGYTYKKDTLYRTARLTFRATSKTSLPVA